MRGCRGAIRAASLALGALLLASPVRALPPEERPWDLQISMYGWLASLDAEIDAGGVQTDVEMSFRDILSDLGWAAMGGVEGRYRRALFAVDVLGMQVVSDASGSGRTRSFQVLANGPGGELHIGEFDVHARLTQWMLDVKPGFRVLSIPTAELFGGTAQPEDRRRFDLDLFAGFRYWNVQNKTGVEIQPATLTVGGVGVPLPDVLPDVDLGHVRVRGALLRGTDKNVQETVDWFDPIVGARVTTGITKRWTVFLSGDVGGWNIGDDSSDFTWQAMLGSRIALSEHWSLQTGYRALGVERDNALANALLHGPQIGALFRF